MNIPYLYDSIGSNEKSSQIEDEHYEENGQVDDQIEDQVDDRIDKQIEDHQNGNGTVKPNKVEILSIKTIMASPHILWKQQTIWSHKIMSVK